MKTDAGVQESPYLLTYPKAAARLGVCVKTLRREIAAKRLRYVTIIGGQRRIDTADIEAYRRLLKEQTPWQGSSSPPRGKGARTATATLPSTINKSVSALEQEILRKLNL